MIPSNALAEVSHDEPAEHRQRDDFLDDLQLRGGIDAVAPAIGRHHQTIFQECDRPAHENGQPEWFAFELQVSVPRERHEDIRSHQQQDRKPSGLQDRAHGFLIFDF